LSFKSPKFRRGRSSPIVVAIVLLLAWFFGGLDQGGDEQQNRSAKRNRGGDSSFAYYSLVLSWSPSHCLRKDRAPAKLQCDSGKPYSFVLHGLWPQHEKGWPEFCGGSPKVSKRLLDSMLDIMPARGLVKHQYKKHGTCSGLSAKSYFDLSRSLFSRISIPDRYQDPEEFVVTNGRDMRDEFISANPGLKPEMFAVNCSGGNENRLKEVKICFDKTGNFLKCGKNEKTSRLCKGRKITVPPTRG